MKILFEDEKDVLQFANADPLASIGRLFTTARSRIAENALSRAVERGTRQIVILGAGLDTFALRSPHGARQIRIYEVDHPATQAWKRQRLAEDQIALPPWLIPEVGWRRPSVVKTCSWPASLRARGAKTSVRAAGTCACAASFLAVDHDRARPLRVVFAVADHPAAQLLAGGLYFAARVDGP